MITSTLVLKWNPNDAIKADVKKRKTLTFLCSLLSSHSFACSSAAWDYRMPYNRTYKPRSAAKRTYNKADAVKRATDQYKRRTRMQFQRMSMVKNVGPDLLPPVRWVKHTYVEQLQLTPIAANSYTAYTFRTNSLFDPDYTSTGHQPYGYDSLAAQYSRYLVYKSTIRVEGWVSAPPAEPPNWLAVYQSRNSAAYPFSSNVNAFEFLRNDNSNTNPKLISNVEGQSALREKTVFAKWDAREAFGKKTIDSIDLEASAQADQSPSEPWYFHVLVMECAGGTPTALRLNIAIDYWVRWTEPKKFTVS